MSPITILTDNREQKPWEFEDYPVEVEHVTLKTGDYAVKKLCDYNEEQDTFYPTCAVERKSPDDFLSSITRNRGRFQKEIKRAATWDRPLCVIIEAPRTAFTSRYSPIDTYQDVHRNRVNGTVDSWGEHFNVEWVFSENRGNAERDAFDKLLTWDREAML